MHDRIPDPCRLLIVGINPGRLTEEVDAPFAYPGNRFWPALEAAGITPYRVHAHQGLSDQDATMLAELGIGFTNLVNRMTPRASELTREEMVQGGQVVRDVVAKQSAYSLVLSFS